MSFQLRPEQIAAVDLLAEKRSGLLLADTGAGKTAVALELVKRMDDVERWLIVAPRLVLYNAYENVHLKIPRFDLDYVIVHKGKWRDVLAEDHHVYLTTTDLVRSMTPDDLEGVDGLIVDEVHRFKNSGSQRTKHLLNSISKNMTVRYGMTGTPATEGLDGLWAQTYLVDRGRTLGRYISHYRSKYFYRGGFKGYEYIPKNNALEDITAAMAPSTVRMEVESDEPIRNVIPVDLPVKTMDLYKRAKRKLKIEYDGAEKLVGEAAKVYGTLRQLPAGSFYGDNKEWEPLHSVKLDALDDLSEELQGKKLLCFYWFKFEKDMIRNYFKKKKKKIEFLDSDTHEEDVQNVIKKWAKGDYRYLFCQPASTGVGIDGLQDGARHIAWLTLPDSLGLYEQANGRIAGKRAEGTITIHHILGKNSIDRIIYDRLQQKSITQKDILTELTDG